MSHPALNSGMSLTDVEANVESPPSSGFQHRTNRRYPSTTDHWMNGLLLIRRELVEHLPGALVDLLLAFFRFFAQRVFFDSTQLRYYLYGNFVFFRHLFGQKTFDTLP